MVNKTIFIKYVIDKDFNNLAYIDTSNIVYDLRKENNNIMFDIEGIFKTSHIINNEYFNLCLKYLKWYLQIEITSIFFISDNHKKYLSNKDYYQSFY